MSERKTDSGNTVKQFGYYASLIDDDEIIDVSALDFDDTDAWLYTPIKCWTKSVNNDVSSWSKSESEIDLSVNKKCIDTRTFTRPKKRSTRNSFESILEGSSPQSTNLWRNQCSSFSNIDENASRHPRVPIDNKEEVVPHMLKIPPMTAANLLANETITVSGQESMEVFLNMSHSKGIDSFINLTDPGLSDPLMNVSQPSILYSSIISLPKEDIAYNVDYAEDDRTKKLSQLDSHAINRLEQLEQSYNLNETFEKRDDSILDNKSYSLNPAEATFTNEPETFENPNLNETYCAIMPSDKAIPNANRHQTSTTNLSSTFVAEDKANIKSQNDERNDLLPPNATYLSQESENKDSLDSTFLCLETLKNDEDVALATGIDVDKNKSQMCDKRVDIDRNSPTNLNETSTPAEKSYVLPSSDNVLHSTFMLPLPLGNQSTPKNADVLLNSTFKTFKKHLDQPRMLNAVLSSTFRAPNSLRKELLMEIQRSEDRRLDSTYNHIDDEHLNGRESRESTGFSCDPNVQNYTPRENKYNTYKKGSSSDCTRNTNEHRNEVAACSQKNFQDTKYYTFTKKTLGIHGRKSDIENAEALENVDSTFVKPLPKLQKKKQNIPRMLSKLPQFLQKSNPNLISNSLKAVSITGSENNVTSMGFMKGSQPNIVRDVEKGLTNKLYSLGNMKSGSEQRLLELSSSAADFQMIGTGGSTESIESTQSAHSAPDLDDRLSTCSDSSHNSYTARTMNIEQLHHIVRMQEESLKQDSTPKPNRRVLENTWVETKENLPSPILKNGVDDSEAHSSLPSGTAFAVKTSTPTLSPTGSSQSINTDSHSRENTLKQQNEMDVTKQIQVSNKSVPKQENKTRLRQPVNWNTGNKATTSIISAIPRPPSRIPGPRFTRPVTKNSQGDTKRGYM